jgi:hypothetical protein
VLLPLFDLPIKQTSGNSDGIESTSAKDPINWASPRYSLSELSGAF